MDNDKNAPERLRTTISDDWVNQRLDADAEAQGEGSRAKVATRILTTHYLTLDIKNDLANRGQVAAITPATLAPSPAA